MNKTALQQLIDKLKGKGKMFEVLTYEGAIKMAESFEEIEKQQIIDAHGDNSISGLHYYNRTFK